ncbi:MAG: membrane protein insertion efficiency factor YidD [Caulobacteraceae bacterium]
MSPSLPALGLLGLIQVYKWTLSPLVGQGCRYKPTCSSYAADAIRMHGAWAGSWMAGARVCRCAPWGGHGWDPAPSEIRKNSWWRPWRYGDWKYREPSPSSLAEEGLGEEGRSNVLTPEHLRAPHPLPPLRKGEGDDTSARVES